MAMKRIEDLSREDLIKRLRLASELASAVDGLWFLAAEEAEGFDLHIVALDGDAGGRE